MKSKDYPEIFVYDKPNPDHLTNFLRTFQVPNNPFLDVTYQIVGAETFGDYVDDYIAANCLVVFLKTRRVEIHFDTKDKVKACYIACFIFFCWLSPDPNAKLFSGSICIVPSDIYDCFNKLYKLPDTCISIQYSQDDYGENAFLFHQQNVLFEITKYHDDFYFYELECVRRHKLLASKK